MAAMAGALVLNIGTLSEHWIEAMLPPGRQPVARSCSTRSVRGDALPDGNGCASSTSSKSPSSAGTRRRLRPLRAAKRDPGRRVDRRGGFGRRPRPGRGGDARDSRSGHRPDRLRLGR